MSGSLAPLDSTNVDGAEIQVSKNASVDPGSAESVDVPGLTPGRRHHFAVRAIDASGTRGPISNVVVAVTPIGGALGGKGVLDVAPRPNPVKGGQAFTWGRAIA